MISVAMTTYNGAQYITEQLESLRLQTRTIDEIVIVDDGSADQTVDLICDYAKQHPECNILLEQNENNLGYKKNFHKAVSLCKGDITFLCDQDDCWMEDKVEKMSHLLETNPEIGILSTAFIRMDGEGNPGKMQSVYQRKMAQGELVQVPIEDLVFHNIAQGCAMAMRKEIKDMFLTYFTDTIPHDWMINIVAAMHKKCYYWNEATLFYRIHGHNTIGLSDQIAFQEKNTIKIRTADARAAIRVLEFIEKADRRFYFENSWLHKAKEFSLQHIKHFEEGHFGGLLVQNLNPCYRKLKRFRGRLLDLIFVLRKR